MSGGRVVADITMSLDGVMTGPNDSVELPIGEGGERLHQRIYAGGIIFALASLWFLTRLGDQPHYLSQYLPGAVLGGIGAGMLLPALTALAIGTLPPTRLATGISVQTTFRQIGAALGLASFVAIAGSSTLATKSDFDGSWLFMAIASAGAGIALAPPFRPRPLAAAVEAQPNPGRVLDAVAAASTEPPEALGFAEDDRARDQRDRSPVRGFSAPRDVAARR